MTIGQRAYKAIRDRADRRNMEKEYDRLGIPQNTASAWKRGKCDPGGYYLRVLALAGYDIYWILTGEERYG